MKKATILIAILIVISPLLITSCAKTSGNEKNNGKEIRIGYFPNITHSQAMVGLSKGIFSKHLGKTVKIKTTVFNAGPSEIEALFSGNLDIEYIGPSPAVNGYIKSEGKALMIIAGAASGGSVLVVRKDAAIKSIKDLDGKKVASPQLGNTQDVSLRHFLQKSGLRAKEKGGSVEVIPTENSNILTLFLKKELDAAWVPEPWGSRLVDEAGGKILIDERELWPDGKFATAVVIVRTEFLKENPDLVKKFLKGHIETTEWINNNLKETEGIANREIEKLTGKRLKKKIIRESFSRLSFTFEPVKSSIQTMADWSYELDFLKEKPDLTALYDLTLLEAAVKEEGDRK